MRISCLLLASSCLSLPTLAAGQAVVESFSPSGTVKEVRQARARFSADMVPLGTLAQPDPFTVDCSAGGQGRWVDTRNWSYDFDADLGAGQRCTFSIRPGLRDLAGQPVAGQVYSFDTGGPAIMQSLPREGDQVAEDQVFVLGLDGDAGAAPIAARAWCKAEGINERIGVRVLGGAAREQVLQANQYFVREFTPEGAPPGSGGRVAVLQCQRTLPSGVPVTLVWDAGIAGRSGVATDRPQQLAFRTRPDFSARVLCERMTPTAGCIPFLPITLAFNAPVARTALAAVTLRGADGKLYPAAAERGEEAVDTVEGISFKGPFPAGATLTLALPGGLADDAGRPLVNAGAFPLQVKTGPYPPLVKFPARFGILEARAKPMLPVTVRAVENPLGARIAPAIAGRVVRVGEEAVIGWLEKLSYSGGWSPREMDLDDMARPLLAAATPARRVTLPRRRGQGAEVIGIPLARPGFYVVEIASPLLGEALAGKPQTAYVSAAALVTNMVAHFKHGARSSVVWVTSLDKGRPVPGAQVSVRGCGMKPVWTGRTDSNGIARIGQELASGCKDEGRFFISARRGDDMTFTLSDWNNGIEPYRFAVSTSELVADDTIAATVFDRTLLRAGETVHMKHFLRRHTLAGVELVAAGDWRQPDRYNWRADALRITDQSARPAKAWVVHQGTDEKFELPLAWDANAISAADWKIPEGAKLGTYEVFIGGKVSGAFRVEQFRIPVMKAVVQGPRAPQVAPASLPLDLQVNYLSGGGASFAPVTLRTTLARRSVSFDGYDGFAFASEQLREGVQDMAGYDEEAYGQEGGVAPAAAVRTRQLTLDRAGGARVALDQLPAIDSPRTLLAELSYQDPNGETQTVSQRVPLWPAAVTIGLRQDDWVASKDALRFQAVVLDPAGKPVAGRHVAIEFFQRTTTTHRKRVIGGLYSYHHTIRVRHAGPACEGATDQLGLLSCTARSPVEGNVIVQARTADDAGRAVFAHRDVWVTGGEDQWFDVSDSDRIDVLPLQKRYEPGQRATFQVRSPFRNATALITVEREGVIDTYVRRLRGKDPTFSIPVKPRYAPNVYVSALVVRGRTGGVQPTALVDLGKPAYKLGIAKVQVGWAAHELKVRVSTDREVYKVRDKVAVKVKVARANGKRLPAGSEIALAAVDTGLLELQPNTSWDLLQTMMQERSLQVETSTAQMQVVGKRHYGRKALPPGGGGGRSAGRELFETLLFWKARLTLDAEGEARVQVPLNDSLTSFRIVAIASGGAGLFGTGAAEVRSSQDLMLLSGLPQLVREGDRVRAGFTVRNASAGAMNASVAVSVAADGASATALPAQQIALEAGQAREIGWDYTVPQGARELAWQVEASAAQVRDLLRVKQDVGAAVPVRTLQATLLQLDHPQSVPVQAPAGALPGRGGIAVRFTPALAGAMPGVREYMLGYPYTCFEQRASRAVALRDRKAWDEVMASLPAHLDGDGLLKYFALMQEGSDTLTAYVLSVADEAGYPVPPELRQRMEQGLTGFVRGAVTRRGALRTADLAVRKVGALEALSRARPVPADLLGSFDVAPELWPTAALLDWYLVLRRSPGLPGRDGQLAQAENVLRARLDLRGATMGFSTARTDGWWWLMMSADANANRLLLAMLDNPAWRADMGRLARGVLGRQQRGRWDTTVANAWGVLAMEKFSAAFENVPVRGASAARIGAATQTVAMPARPGHDTVSFAWPRGVQQLGLAHSGTGAPWATVQSRAAVPLAVPVSAGFRIARTVTPLERKDPGKWSRGDVYRVRLDLDAQSDMTWVVVDDPVPAGATILGSGLGRDSRIQSAGERGQGPVTPAFRERASAGLRAYYESVPKGKWSLEYTVRLNNAGQFTMPSTRVEAMYNPDMFGELPNPPVTVAQ